MAKDDDGRDNDRASIVGFWHQKLVIPGTNGVPDVLVDDGLSQWRIDGTEMLNSASRPATTGNFCMGVWDKVGWRTYKLNHFPLLYDSTGRTFAGPAHLQAEVTVSADGKEYRGTFKLDAYSEDKNGNLTLVPPSAEGVITGTRITVDTTPEDLF